MARIAPKASLRGKSAPAKLKKVSAPGTIAFPFGETDSPQNTKGNPPGEMHYPHGTGDNPQGEHQNPRGTKANPQGTESNPQGEAGFPQGTGGNPQGENEKYRGDLLRSLGNFLKNGGWKIGVGEVCRLQIGGFLARITNTRQRGFSNLIHMGLDISSDRLS